MLQITFVCLGNICRSPLAEGIFNQLLVKNKLTHKIKATSSGTSNYHIGENPDYRAIEIAKIKGIDISNYKATQFSNSSNYDYILAMDQDNLKNIQRIIQPFQKSSRLLHFSELYKDQDVPDPYWGGPKGFEKVFEMIYDGCDGFLKFIINENH